MTTPKRKIKASPIISSQTSQPMKPFPDLALTFVFYLRAQQIEGQNTRFIFSSHHLEFVVEVLDARNLDLDTLAFPHILDDLTGLAGRVKDGTTRKNSPVVKH